jgi:cysteine-rich repeat protein
MHHWLHAPPWWSKNLQSGRCLAGCEVATVIPAVPRRGPAGRAVAQTRATLAGLQRDVHGCAPYAHGCGRPFAILAAGSGHARCSIGVRMRTALLVLALVFPFGVAASHATTATDVCTVNNVPSCGCVPTSCAAASGVCVLPVVKNGITVAPGSTLDFGQCTLRVPAGAQLVVGPSSPSATMTITAAGVDLQATANGAGLMRATGGTITIVAATGDINVRKMGNATARIDVSGDPNGTDGGTIDITASAGNVAIDGVLNAGANASNFSGGSVSLAGTNVSLGSGGEIDIDGKGGGAGGFLTIDAASNLTLGGKIDGSAGDLGGGEIDLGVHGTLVSSANIDLQSTQGGGGGGILTISGSNTTVEPVFGSVTLGGSIDLSDKSSGDGGELDVGDIGSEVIGAILIAGPINASSGTGGGGGTVSMLADGNITLNAAIQVKGNGTDGLGGTASFEAHQALTLGSITIDASGDVGNGGEIDGTAWCSLSLPGGATVDSGDSGMNTLQSGGSMTIAGKVRAVNGSNEFDWLTAMPVVTGTVVPAPLVVQDTTLTPCGGGPATCGNGKIDPGEQCDGTTPPGCTSPQSCVACQCVVPPRCGDGHVDPGEQCDDGNTNNCDSCSNACTLVTGCGDGVVCGTAEKCDDGNTTNGDACDNNCTTPGCGNGELDPGEQCDDGKKGSATCSTSCKLMPPANCGNGTVDAPGEQCDDGPRNGCGDPCTTFCLFACGDGVIECNEQCDDGNTVSNDGCSSTCQIEFCGDGITQTSEECDDGARNGVLGDPCSSTCTLHWCGDGVVDTASGEVCDDANTNNCDGCNTDCMYIPPNHCPTCTSDNNDRNECNPCSNDSQCSSGFCGDMACIAGACTPIAPPNCDDGDPCTIDPPCNAFNGCVHTPKGCDDGNACNGPESCDPTSGQCVQGAAPDCDDGDACTDNDRCETSGTGYSCVTTARTGQAGVECRLGAIEQVLNGSSDLKKASKKKMAKLVKQIRAKLPAAAGTGKKATKAHKVVSARLQSLMNLLSHAKADPGTIGALRDAVSKAIAAVGTL